MDRKPTTLSTIRRRHPRRARTTSGWLLLRGDTSARGVTCVDLGRQGAQFRTLKPIDAGEQVLVGLQLDSGTAVECKGKVCWSRRLSNGVFNSGVRFVDLVDDEDAAIERFLDSPNRKEAALQSYEVGQPGPVHAIAVAAEGL